jgi:hypothetical protein
VTKSGGETVTKVDDGTNTTRVTEMNGQTTIRVTNDATHKVVSGYVGSGSNISVGGGQGPHVTVTKHGSETTTTVDNGTGTAVVEDTNGKSTVSVARDDGSLAGIGGMIANMEKLLHAQTSAGTSSTAPTAASATTTSPAGTPPAASGGTTAAAGAVGTAPAAASASSSTSATPKDLASLMALSPDQFMQAVTSGKIPDDVANSQSAMMQVQARMNQITQMNQLVTGMMAAMHQMQMSIIQNIRC